MTARPEPDEEQSWHYWRECHLCGHAEGGYLHCMHDGIQNACHKCGGRMSTVSGECECAFVATDSEFTALRADVAALRGALEWALDYIADGLEVPAHECEFTTNPEKGACDFHEAYFGACDTLAAAPALAADVLDEADSAPWQCEACGEEVPAGTTSHGRAEHAPSCDGTCRSGCPVEVECGPCSPVRAARDAFEKGDRT